MRVCTVTVLPSPLVYDSVGVLPSPTRTGLADQHHAVGDVGIGAVIGLDEAQAGLGAEPQAIRAGEVLVRRQRRQIHLGEIGIGLGAEQVNIPGECRRGGVA